MTLISVRKRRFLFTTFADVLESVFGHSPWIAEKAWNAHPFETIDDLHPKMMAVVRDAAHTDRLALIRARPDLANPAAVGGDLTEASSLEKLRDGLDQCTPEEIEHLQGLNRAYRDRFAFPFIMAVRGRTVADVLAGMTGRLANSPDPELDTALEEIGTIAHFRLLDIVRT